ncbi:MAG: hypothetical protein KGL35_08840 [Bradyrhizobium sp.]|nr:hypothetical protein [Bradyrhizobium sp.]
MAKSDTSPERGSLTQRRTRMWQSMRILRQFTVEEIVATACVSAQAAYRYINALAGDGYLECLRSYKAGRGDPHRALWKIKRDTGPFAPIGGGRGDPNLNPDLERMRITIPRADYERALKSVRACAGMADPEREVAELKRLAGEAHR